MLSSLQASTPTTFKGWGLVAKGDPMDGTHYQTWCPSRMFRFSVDNGCHGGVLGKRFWDFRPCKFYFIRALISGKVTAIIKERKIEVFAAQSRRVEAIKGKLAKPPWNPLLPALSRINDREGLAQGYAAFKPC